MRENKHCWKQENHTVRHTMKLDLPESVKGGILNLNQGLLLSLGNVILLKSQCRATSLWINYRNVSQNQTFILTESLYKICCKQNTNIKTEYLTQMLFKMDGSIGVNTFFWEIILWHSLAELWLKAGKQKKLGKKNFLTKTLHWKCNSVNKLGHFDVPFWQPSTVMWSQCNLDLWGHKHSLQLRSNNRSTKQIIS